MWVDGEAVGPACAAWEDVGGVVAAGECGHEELVEGGAADALPGLIDVAVFVDPDAACVDELFDAHGRGVEADLKDTVLGEVDEVDAAVAEGAGGVSDAAAAGEGAAGAECAAFLRAAAAAPADASPDGLAGAGRGDFVGQAGDDGEEPEGAAGDVDERAHQVTLVSRWRARALWRSARHCSVFASVQRSHRHPRWYAATVPHG